MEQKKEGKVWLVGAGPSDAELLTLKAKRVLEQAEVVVYDRLVGESILLMMPEAAEKIDAGKRSGNHTIPQEQMNELLLKKAQEGKCVVRLKGGDPFLFGRGGEELELLAKHNIPFEVVPGVTSAISVPAYNGIPVTHRDYASSVHIITGHKKKDEPLNLDFTTLAKLEGTLVFLMGVSALTDICQGLCNGGKAKETPAALLSRGTTAKQRRIVSTLEKLPEEVKKNPMETPAVIVVGEVCGLSDEFNWYEKLTLFGKKIIVTRPRERSRALAERLRSLGAEVLELPTIEIHPNDNFSNECDITEKWIQKNVEDTETQNENQKAEMHIDMTQKLSDVLLNDYQYVVFTSPSGVNCFFDQLKKEKIDIRRFFRAKIAALGAGTAKELELHGVFADLVPEVYDAAHLGICIGEACADGNHILIPRVRNGSQELIREIQKRKKVTIADLPIYDTIEKEQKWVNVPKLVEEGCMVVFTSASTVRGFVKNVPDTDLSHVQGICIGKQTAQEAKKTGISCVTAKSATVENLVQTILNCSSQSDGK